jgi:hypothetical protein
MVVFDSSNGCDICCPDLQFFSESILVFRLEAKPKRMNTTVDKPLLAWRSDAYALAALLLLAAALFHGTPLGYWRADDSAILWHAINSKGLSAFYDPSDWQKLSPSNLTPWLTLSFKVDLWLAGLAPHVFYIHSLCSLAFVVVAAYALNRQWIPPVWAFLSVGLFLVGAPTASVTELLMTRHYLEGLLFAVLSSIAFVQAMRRQDIRWAFVGAVAYALAATAKEIYVPLVLVILLIPPVGLLKTRLKLVAPYVAVAALYILWRRYMLGAMIGGYVEANSIVSWQSATAMAATLRRFPEFFFGPTWILPSVLLIGSLGIAAFRKPLATLVFAALAVGVVVPLIPLIAFPGISGPDRYLFLFWFVASFSGVLAVQILVTIFPSKLRLWESIGITLVLVVGSAAFSHTVEMQKSYAASYREFDTQGRFYFEANQRQGFVPSQTLLHSYWYVTNLCDIKKRLALECPASLIKGVALDQPIEHLFAYDPVKNAMVNMSDRLQEERTKIETIDTSRPLQASISVSNGMGRWSLGPYEGGQYFFASSLIGRYPVTRQGSLKTQLTHLAFYIQYESPEGWATSSPMLVAGTETPVAWKR